MLENPKISEHYCVTVCNFYKTLLSNHYIVIYKFNTAGEISYSYFCSTRKKKKALKSSRAIIMEPKKRIKVNYFIDHT